MNDNCLLESGLNLNAKFMLDELPIELLGALKPAIDDLSSAKQLVVFANGGRAFWTAFEASGVAGDHPVDQFSMAMVHRYMKAVSPTATYQILYPSSFCIPLQALGTLAGWHHPSPLFIGINAQWGLWFAYRVVIVTDTPLGDDALTSEPIKNYSNEKDKSPCYSCLEKPCVKSCPADAIASGKFAINKCVEYRTRERSACGTQCISRNQCPVAKQHRYTAEQIKYHYSRSLEYIVKHSK